MVVSNTDQNLEEDQILDIQSELDETEKSLREVTLKIEQSQAEVGKLTQRNAAITTDKLILDRKRDRKPGKRK